MKRRANSFFEFQIMVIIILFIYKIDFFVWMLFCYTQISMRDASWEYGEKTHKFSKKT